MNKSSDRLKESVNDGWIIQVYSGDRRLLCSIYPSHGWAFFIGILLGFAVALIGLQNQSVNHSRPSVSMSTQPAFSLEAPLNLD